jgi:hypothetical protein
VRFVVCVLLSLSLIQSLSGAEILGFFAQKFNSINFEKGKWTRSEQLPCQIYTATDDGAMVNVMRFGTNNLVPFKATKNLKVVVCGSSAAFDEGFEAKVPALSTMLR